MSSYSLPALLHKRVPELSFLAFPCVMSPAVRTKKAWIEVSPNWHLKHDLDTKARLIWLEITIRTKKNENVVSFHIVVGVKTVHKATLPWQNGKIYPTIVRRRNAVCVQCRRIPLFVRGSSDALTNPRKIVGRKRRRIRLFFRYWADGGLG